MSGGEDEVGPIPGSSGMTRRRPVSMSSKTAGSLSIFSSSLPLAQPKTPSANQSRDEELFWTQYAPCLSSPSPHPSSTLLPHAPPSRRLCILGADNDVHNNNGLAMWSAPAEMKRGLNIARATCALPGHVLGPASYPEESHSR